uniref:RNase III domain-containing protein n=1 Tax=Chrysotila carterae TaxID=13221 RepID=A0A6S9SNR1_CHRCT|mmetsp:Transcript_695/g.1403  ORF Transcript_695/g.1403 Transcript_695/m.1403 type:complete len:170 (+) Transcript_695:126-635(+)
MYTFNLCCVLLCMDRIDASRLGGARVFTPSRLRELSPAVLAYIGDSVFELRARQHLMWPPIKLNDHTKQVQKVVCAEAQEKYLAKLLIDVELSEEEHEWLRRGRNASGRGPSRVTPTTYRAASSLETLLGYLHFTNITRLQEILDAIFPPEVGMTGIDSDSTALNEGAP